MDGEVGIDVAGESADGRDGGQTQYFLDGGSASGRKRLDDRKALCGILFVLYTGIPWEFLPQEMGYGSG